MIRTKIVATLGPASSSVDTLVRMFEEGVDVCRLNFSHGDLADHGRTLANVREAVRRFGEHIAVLGDLCGPKIRLGPIADDGSGGMKIDIGDTLHIGRQPIVGAHGQVSTIYPQFVDDVSVGDRILVEDGLLRFLIIEKTPDEVICICKEGGTLKSGKGINLPNTAVSIPSITERDWRSVNWAIANDLDFLALSFVRRPDELVTLRRYLDERASKIDLIAKIEKAEAIEHIERIIDASGGLMIARGDLGVEMDVAQVPLIQKDLIRRCQAAGKRVIVATQMLQSMIDQSSPTRAEVSDVANAIFDGTDAVMLSGETAVGKHPLAAVHVMQHVAQVTEEYLDAQDPAPRALIKAPPAHLTAAIARGVRQIVADVGARLVVVWSQTGTTARVFSKHRFPIPVLAIATSPAALRQMALCYGVIPIEMAAPTDMTSFIAQVDRLVRQQSYAQASDRLVIVAGSVLGAAGAMNGIVIHTVGQSPAAAAPAPGGTAPLQPEKP